MFEPHVKDSPSQPKRLASLGIQTVLPVSNWPRETFLNRSIRVAAGCAVLLALLATPTPLLPPHRLAEAVQSIFGIDGKLAYLGAAVVLQSVFYSSLGVLAAIAVNRSPTLRGQLLQIGIVSVCVLGLAALTRTLKAGYLPVWINAAVPVASCLVGVMLGLGLLYRQWKATLTLVVLITGVALWGLLGGSSSALRIATEAHLQRLASVGSDLPQGEARFGALLRTAFAPLPDDSIGSSMVQHNRAAILAWGVALGDYRLARFIGLDPDSTLVRRAAALSQGTTIHGREDWPRHYALSAALAVLEHPLFSDAGGLIKEQLDALTRDSGFSFGDLAADRAGVRFAVAATASEAAARTMRLRLQNRFTLDDFFPEAVDFPDSLTVESFRRDFGGVGSKRYRQELIKIETELDRCRALSPTD